MKRFRVIIILLFLGSSSLSAQSRYSYGFKASYVLNGFLKSDPYENNFSTNKIIPGPSFTIGLQHGYFLNKKKNLSLGVGILYEHSAFSKLNIRDINEDGKYKKKQQIRSQYILLPIDIEYQFKKFSFSAGIIYSSLFSIKMKLMNCYTETSRCNYRISEEIQYNLNDHYEPPNSPFPRSESVFIDERSNLQFKIGVHYQLNKQIKIGMEYRDFIFENNLHVTRIAIDLVEVTTYIHQTNAIDFSIQYLF